MSKTALLFCGRGVGDLGNEISDPGCNDLAGHTGDHNYDPGRERRLMLAQENPHRTSRLNKLMDVMMAAGLGLGAAAMFTGQESRVKSSEFKRSWK